MTSTHCVVDFRLAYRLSRKHDIAFLKGIAHNENQDQILLSQKLKQWLLRENCQSEDICKKLHLLMELEKEERKRHFGFQFRGQAMAFQIVYIDRVAWDKRLYRERLTGENHRKVQRMLHVFLFDEMHLSKEQRLNIVKDMMLDPMPADEMA